MAKRKQVVSATAKVKPSNVPGAEGAGDEQRGETQSAAKPKAPGKVYQFERGPWTVAHDDIISVTKHEAGGVIVKTSGGHSYHLNDDETEPLAEFLAESEK